MVGIHRSPMLAFISRPAPCSPGRRASARLPARHRRVPAGAHEQQQTAVGGLARAYAVTGEPARTCARTQKASLSSGGQAARAFMVVLKVMPRSAIMLPAARQHALTNVHHRMLLATLANHSGVMCLKRRT